MVSGVKGQQGDDDWWREWRRGWGPQPPRRHHTCSHRRGGGQAWRRRRCRCHHTPTSNRQLRVQMQCLHCRQQTATPHPAMQMCDSLLAVSIACPCRRSRHQEPSVMCSGSCALRAEYSGIARRTSRALPDAMNVKHGSPKATANGGKGSAHIGHHTKDISAGNASTGGHRPHCGCALRGHECKTPPSQNEQPSARVPANQ